jgi:hypothetical protein
MHYCPDCCDVCECDGAFEGRPAPDDCQHQCHVPEPEEPVPSPHADGTPCRCIRGTAGYVRHHPPGGVPVGLLQALDAAVEGCANDDIPASSPAPQGD